MEITSEMHILLIDNEDSFTYNLVRLIGETGAKADVRSNRALVQLDLSVYQGVVIGPGPGTPEDAGEVLEFLERKDVDIPLFGICLGMQAMAVALGGKLKNMLKLFHGMATRIEVTDHEFPLFWDLPPAFPAGRYHSWVVDEEGLPSPFRIAAMDEAGEIMALYSPSAHWYGVQFHPESILTPGGKSMMSRFCQLCEASASKQPQ